MRRLSTRLFYSARFGYNWLHTLVKTHEAASKQRQAVVLQLATAAIVERILEVSGIDQLIPRASSRSGAIQIIQELANTDDGSA